MTRRRGPASDGALAAARRVTGGALAALLVAGAAGCPITLDAGRAAAPDARPDVRDDAACAPGQTRPCFSGPPEARDRGACRSGVAACVAPGRWDDACHGEALPAPAERCGDGVDDDCDGTPDDGCAACAGARPCYPGPAGTLGVGACRGGLERCVDGARWDGRCEGAVTPAREVCDNLLDDDCDGTTDEGCDACPPERCPRLARLDLSGNTACMVTREGAVWCFGRGDSGELGTGDTAWRAVPTPAPRLPTATDVAVGLGHTCALTAAGEVHCVGSNRLGALGTPEGAGSAVDLSARRVPLPARALEVAAGYGFTCARLEGDAVWCWGANDRGQLAAPVAPYRAAPARVEGLDGVVSLDAGWLHMCALRGDGTVACWGDHSRRQLGAELPGGATFSATPVEVTGLTDARAVEAGFYHTCAVRGDGTAACWGRNTLGQLGDGTRTTRATPVRVLDLTDAVAVAGGEEHSCAIRRDGSAWCWGDNNGAELGDGTTNSTTRPVRVVTDLRWQALDGSLAATCGIDADGVGWCWGSNHDARGGLGPVRISATPRRLPWP